MPDLVSSVKIIATDETGAAYQAATANSQLHTDAVQANAQQFQRIRSEQDAVEKAWGEAIQENTARMVAAEETRAAAAAATAAKVTAAVREQEARYQELGRTMLSVAQGGGVAGAIGGLGEIAGVALLGATLEHVVDKTKDEALELGHLSVATGISVMQLAELEAELKRTGAEHVNLNMLVMRMSATMLAARNPLSQQHEKLRELGVDTRALEAGTLSLIDAQQQIAIHLANSTKGEQDLGNMRAIAGRNAIPYVAFLKEEGDNLTKNMQSHRDLGAAMAGAVGPARDLQKIEADMSEAWKKMSAEILPLVTAGLKGLDEAFDILGWGAASASTIIQAMFSGMFLEIETSGKVFNDLQHGHFSQAASDAAAGAKQAKVAWQDFLGTEDALAIKFLDDNKKRWAVVAPEKPSGETDTDKSSGAKGVAEQARIAEQIAEIDKKNALTRLNIWKESQEQKHKMGLSTEDDLTGALLRAENARYAIEVETANKINAEKATAAKAEGKPVGPGIDLTNLNLEHQQAVAKINDEATLKKQKEDETANKVTERWNEAHAKITENGIKDLEKLREAEVKQAKEVAAIQVKAQEESSARIYELAKIRLDTEKEAGKISEDQRIAQLKKLEDQEYATAVAAAERAKADALAGGDLPAAARAQAMIEELAQKHAIKMATIAKDETKGINAAWTSSFHRIQEDSERLVTAMVSSHKSMGHAIKSVWDGMLQNMVKNLMMGVAQALVAHAMHRAMAQKDVLIEAKTAAVKAGNAVANIPFVGPVLAPIAAATTFAALMAFGSFELGGVVPKTGMNITHAGERVLTERQNTTFEKMVESGGSRPSVTNTYQGYPGESPHSIARNSDAWDRAIRDGRLRLSRA